MATKGYTYKVFASNNVYLTTWTDVTSEFTYSQELNTGGSAVEVELARTSDPRTETTEQLVTQGGDQLITEDGNEFVVVTDSPFAVGFGTDVALNNNVEVYVNYGERGDRVTVGGDTRVTKSGDTRVANDGSVIGRKIFTGYISKVISNYGSSETTKITILSFGAELDNYILESGSDTEITYNSYDPSDILRDVLTKFNVAGGEITYSSSSIQDTGTTVSYLVKMNTVLEAVDRCLKLAPTDWFWYVDQGNNILYFKPRPTVSSHRFILGKHIQNFSVEQHIEDITNVVYFTGGDIGGGINLFEKYTDSASISNYRRGLEKITDNRVTDTTSAAIIAASEINRKKEPLYRSSITILSEVYPIEDIVVGQLVSFGGFGNFVDSLKLQIMSLHYSPDSVTLQLGSTLPAVSKRVEDIKRNLQQKEVENNPSQP